MKDWRQTGACNSLPYCKLKATSCEPAMPPEGEGQFPARFEPEVPVGRILQCAPLIYTPILYNQRATDATSRLHFSGFNSQGNPRRLRGRGTLRVPKRAWFC